MASASPQNRNARASRVVRFLTSAQFLVAWVLAAP
jgi:hypothetical protein